jgi:hypothetical protein
MRFTYDDRVGTLTFESQDEFTGWVSERLRRAGDRFPGEVETVGAIGPMCVMRMNLDDEAQVAAAFEKSKVQFGKDLVAIRIPLDLTLSILQIEVRDTESGLMAQWNFGRTSDFNRIDSRPPVSSQPSPPVGEQRSSAEAILDFGLAYSALARSKDFSITDVAPADLKSSRRLFAGFCARCDGLLQRTGLKVTETDNKTVFWEALCLDCDQRFLDWRTGHGRVPSGWKRAALDTSPR